MIIDTFRFSMRENFGQFSTGSVLPSGFTDRWVSTNIAYAVQTEAIAGSVSGKELKLTSSATARRAITFDRPGNAFSDGEVVSKLYAVSSGAGSGIQCGVALRVSGAAASETGYGFGLYESGAGLHDRVGLVKYVAGTVTDITAVAFAWSYSTRYYLRFQAIGTALRGRAWAASGSEPSAWNIDTTDSAVSTAGYAAIYLINANPDPAYDWISVSRGQAGAPLPT